MEEPYRCFTQEDALYVANLIHRDSKAVMKVVRYGLNIQCFPDAHAVALVEKQIAGNGRNCFKMKSSRLG
jgi:hypothetical protein